MRSKRIHNAYQNMTLTDAINLMISESGRPEKAIAADIGKPLSTFQRELNPNDDGAKVGVDTLFPLTHACHGNNPQEAPVPLVWFCHRLGFEPIPFGSAEPSADTIERECLESVQSVAKAHSAIIEGKHPNDIDALMAKAKIDLDQDATLYRRQWEATNRTPQS